MFCRKISLSFANSAVLFVRGWMLLEHLKLWHEWNAAAGNPFHGKVDLARVALGRWLQPRIDEVIQQVGLEVKRDFLIRGLSRGMKQRLGIARAIIHKPKVLLLDEPASGLDPKARVDLRNLLLELRSEGATVLISSHILPDLEGFCTSIGVMEKGLMVRSGRVEEITAQESQHLRVVRMRCMQRSAGADFPRGK